jgi:3-dehydroquinate synthase
MTMDAIIVSDLRSALMPFLDKTPKGQVFVVVDENTSTKCMPVVAEALGEVAYETIVIPAGESHKTLAAVEQIWNALYDHQATREALLLNVGGGMVTDLGGFAAATYMRGIRYVNIPTSLLAMVDASSGGKTGFNYLGVKNMIGSFALPEQTLVYLPLMESLPVKEWLSGYAEMLKHGLLDSEAHWKNLLALDVDDAKCSISSDLLAENIAIKEHIVEADPKEKGLRKLLNFGHTVGHAIEEAYHAEGKDVKHGFCVLWGMVAELYLSVVKMGLDKDVLRQMSNVMLAYYGRPECNCKDRERLVEWMMKDKKNRVAGEINFSLLRAIGDGVVDQTVTREELDEAMEYVFSL